MKFLKPSWAESVKCVSLFWIFARNSKFVKQALPLLRPSESGVSHGNTFKEASDTKEADGAGE